jgi:ribonuclease P protein component
MIERFGPEARLRNRVEFKAVEAGGRRVAARYVTLMGKPNGRANDRLGVIASRRVGGAVARNRAKRRLREVFRRRGAGADARALDVVAIAKAEIVRAPFAAVRTDFLAALMKLRGAR